MSPRSAAVRPLIPQGFEARLASGERWQVKPEPGWLPTGAEGVCSIPLCFGDAVAMRPARTYRGDDYLLCDRHLREASMWIEGGRVVSWYLGR